MLFNSLQFAVFFVIVYGLYLLLDHKWQNRMLLLASYVFYGAWDWRFLALLFFSTLYNFGWGLAIHKTPDVRRQRLFLILAVFGNLAVLGFFKYFHFFQQNLICLLNFCGLSLHPVFLNIILPLGISFYTFQAMSYVLDIYRRQMIPTEKFFDFALFVAFFPQLVAGPIERAKNLLPQIQHPRHLTMEKFFEGAHLVLWGLFLKVYIGDNLAKIVDPIFTPGLAVNGAAVLVGTYAFCFQAFCDFAGYSKMARGLAKMMGIEIMVNFRLPYFVTNPQAFWNHWHISLSSWVRDYIYFPVFASLQRIRGTSKVYIAVMVAMILMGLWHGAAWNFVLWGVYNGLAIVIYTVLRPKVFKWVTPRNPVLKNVWLAVRILWMFQVSAVGMLIFRSAGYGHMMVLLRTLFFRFHWEPQHGDILLKVVLFIAPLLVIQVGKFVTGDLRFLYRRHWVLKTYAYSLMTYLLLGWGVFTAERFIYFQF